MLFVKDLKLLKIRSSIIRSKRSFRRIGGGNESKQNNEAKIFNPEKFSSQRQRQGYQEGDYTLFHTMPIMDFIKQDDPINQLGSLNKFDLPAPKDDDNDDHDHEWKILSKLKLCTELLECIKDLKFWEKFKMILKFRKQARDILGIDKDEEEEKEENPKLRLNH